MQTANDNHSQLDRGPVIPETLETLKSESQIKAEREHQERLKALADKPMANVTSRVDLSKVPLDEIPLELIKKLRDQWEQEKLEQKPALIFGYVPPTNDKNNASILIVYHDGEINIKPLSIHEYEVQNELPHQCRQGCEDVPNFMDALNNVVFFLEESPAD